tara:strand:- start:1510 stop:2598 length:1089 start_codon:yes stop_codon:yes gene_type:complete
MKVRISEDKIWSFVYFITILKVILFIFFTWISPEYSLVGGGNDADYYHDYALGYSNLAVNYWPIILRFLNEMGFYDRNILTLIIFVSSITILPILFYKMVKIQTDEIKLVKAGSIFLVIFYPSLLLFTLDIYREILMFTILALSLIIYKKILETNKSRNKIYFLIYLSLSYFLYLLREYLGFALLLTPFVYLILSKTKKYIKTWIIGYFAILILVKTFGGLDEILDYREGFDQGGTTIGIKLFDQNPFMFLFYYLYSVLAQLFGLFLVNLNSIITFIFESIPFTLAFIYLSKNVKFMSKFVIFLLTFFVIYSTIWLLGNDNLGTAVRLRVPSYLVIFACMFIVYQTKVVTGYEMIKSKSKEI